MSRRTRGDIKRRLENIKRNEYSKEKIYFNQENKKDEIQTKLKIK